MTLEMWIVVAVAIAAIAAFISERLPIDQVALGVPVILLVTGVIDLEAALSGVGNPATITVAAMLVLGIGLDKTGTTRLFAVWARRVPIASARGRLVFLCLVVAGISPFLSNTATVAMFIPLFVTAAATAGETPSRYLIPLSFSAILGGTVTLIGSSTNLVVQNLAKNRGYDDLSIFSIAPLGLIYLAVGMLYLFTIGRWLLPSRRGAPVVGETYERREFVAELTLTEDSTAVGKRLSELDWVGRYHLQTIEPAGSWFTWPPPGVRPLQVGDRLLFRGPTQAILECARVERLATAAGTGSRALEFSHPGTRIVEVFVSPHSRLAGATIGELGFSRRYGAVVLALQRRHSTVRRPLSEIRLEVGDLLLLQGSPEALEALAADPAFSPVGEVSRPASGRPGPLISGAILAGVVAVSALELASLTAAAVVGVVVMIYTRCIRLGEIYREVDWAVLALLVGLVPLGVAMDQTGLAAWLGTRLGEWVGPLGPTVTIACFYLVTSLLTELMTNQAAAVVLTPIALTTASQLDMNPYALAVAVMFGASASFMTPTGYPTNTLVYGPGGYRYRDYAKVGAPLNLVLTVVAAIAIPILFP